MVGVVLIAIVLAFALPVALMAAGAVWSALAASALLDDTASRTEGGST